MPFLSTQILIESYLITKKRRETEINKWNYYPAKKKLNKKNLAFKTYNKQRRRGGNIWKDKVKRNQNPKWKNNILI